MDQNEVKYDKLLKIKTTGRDDSRSDQYCYPYEPTPYWGKRIICSTMDVEKAGWIFFWHGRSGAGLQVWSTMNA